jgi:NADH:ubiquinone oxidoreductase subunit 3 (subunit A)
MQTYYSEYVHLLIFFVISVVLGIILLSLSFFLSKKRTLDSEKLSAYECGFEPFGDTRSEFNVHFFLIGILFIIFDLEVVILFPWAVSLGSLPSFGLWSAIDFLIELTIGFVYVWLIGALEL